MSGRPRSLLLDLTRLNGKADETADNSENEGPVYRAEIVLALEEAGIKKEDIYGLEAPWKNKYYVVFKSSQMRHSKIDKAVKIRDAYFHLKLPYPPQQARTQKTRVRIYGYPLDESTKNLETVLRQYGSFEAESTKDLIDWTVDLKSGIKELYMDINKAVPSYITVGRYKVKIGYNGQQQTCKKCHQPGHYGNECTKDINCRECGASDHVKKNCPKACCFGCGEIGHLSHQCPKDYPSIEEILEREKEEELERQTSETDTDNTLTMDTFDTPPSIIDWPETTYTENETEDGNKAKGKTTQEQPDEDGKIDGKEQDEQILKDLKEIDERPQDKEKEIPNDPKETEIQEKEKETTEDRETGEKQNGKVKEKETEDKKETENEPPDKRKDGIESMETETEKEKKEKPKTNNGKNMECEHEKVTVFMDVNDTETNTNTEKRKKEKESETETDSSEGSGFTEVKGKRKRLTRKQQSKEAKRMSSTYKAKQKPKKK